MIPHIIVLQVQALAILQAMTLTVYTTREIGLPKGFGDLAGTLSSEKLLIVKLRVSKLAHWLKPEDIESMFKRDIRIFRYPEFVAVIRKELWVAKPDGGWQFFEILETEIREVHHDH